MKIARKRSHLVALLLIAIVTASLALALGAAVARASDGGMSGMSGMQGMSAQEMQNMATPTPAPSVTAVSGNMAPAMDPHMDMGGGSANWFVVGGFVALIAATTLAAVATKRHLRRRMLTGELAGAGIQDV
jgi:hypothetical protein